MKIRLFYRDFFQSGRFNFCAAGISLLGRWSRGIPLGGGAVGGAWGPPCEARTGCAEQQLTAADDEWRSCGAGLANRGVLWRQFRENDSKFEYLKTCFYPNGTRVRFFKLKFSDKRTRRVRISIFKFFHNMSSVFEFA